LVITFQGASDDLVEIDGAPGADEFNVYPKNDYAGTWLVQSQEAPSDLRFLVDAYYMGTWSFAVRQVDEGDRLPGNMMILSTTNDTINDYTMLLWIDTGDIDVEIIQYNRP
jgi:hypothetical protein